GWLATGSGQVVALGRWRAGAALVARGEFSIVIAGLGVEGGLAPGLRPLATAYVLFTAVLGPIRVRATETIGKAGVRRDPGWRGARRRCCRQTPRRSRAWSLTSSPRYRDSGSSGRRRTTSTISGAVSSSSRR